MKYRFIKDNESYFELKEFNFNYTILIQECALYCVIVRKIIRLICCYEIF